MKPIHKVADQKNIRTKYRYIQVKNGFVYATDAHKLIKMPVNEVFPEGVVAPDEEIYFEASMWASAKMDKAALIEREDLVFTAKDKNGNSIGVIKAISKDAMRGIARFPEVDGVLPDESAPVAIDGIGIDPVILYELCIAFGSKNKFYCSFFGQDRAIVVRQSESGGVGLVMPVIFLDDKPSYKKAEDVTAEETATEEAITDEEFEDLLG